MTETTRQAAVCAQGAAAGAGRLRLTRRGRRLLACLAVLGALGLAALAGPALAGQALPGQALPGLVLPGGGAPGGDLRLAGEGSIVVEPGDSLWSIATSLAGEHDPRDVVDAIQEVNGMVGTDVFPGQELALP